MGSKAMRVEELGEATRRERPDRRRMGGLLVAACLMLSAAAASAAHGQGVLSAEAERAVRQSLVGTWAADVGGVSMRLTLSAEGRFALDGKTGDFRVEGSAVKLVGEGGEAAYQYTLSRDQLTLSGGGLGQPLTFLRQAEAAAFLRRLFNLSPEAAKRSMLRISVIVAVVAICRFVIAALGVLSRFMIVSDWSPLRFLYRERKGRALTLYSLALNSIKYVVYFTALGFVLSELGVKYTAYLASLSVIGLAIGFGSQGLVQDMVTGFFIIFEAHFEVGDMVEISGQVGVVEDLGLRITKLRNFLGQTVVIPNRNISVVGTFAGGGQHARVDVAATGSEAASKAAPLLRTIGEELRRQFPGALRAEPELVEPLSLRTGEHFARMHLTVWPGQGWVIEQQLVPRVGDVLKREGFQIPSDRIAVSYHAKEERSVRGWGHTLKGLRRRLMGPQKEEHS